MNGIDTTVAWRVEAKRLVMELGPDWLAKATREEVPGGSNCKGEIIIG